MLFHRCTQRLRVRWNDSQVASMLWDAQLQVWWAKANEARLAALPRRRRDWPPFFLLFHRCTQCWLVQYFGTLGIDRCCIAACAGVQHSEDSGVRFVCRENLLQNRRYAATTIWA
jgi:hypothetical protein